MYVYSGPPYSRSVLFTQSIIVPRIDPLFNDLSLVVHSRKKPPKIEASMGRLRELEAKKSFDSENMSYILKISFRKEKCFALNVSFMVCGWGCKSVSVGFRHHHHQAREVQNNNSFSSHTCCCSHVRAPSWTSWQSSVPKQTCTPSTCSQTLPPSTPGSPL